MVSFVPRVDAAQALRHLQQDPTDSGRDEAMPGLHHAGPYDVFATSPSGVPEDRPGAPRARRTRVAVLCGRSRGGLVDISSQVEGLGRRLMRSMRRPIRHRRPARVPLLLGILPSSGLQGPPQSSETRGFRGPRIPEPHFRPGCLDVPALRQANLSGWRGAAPSRSGARPHRPACRRGHT